MKIILHNWLPWQKFINKSNDIFSEWRKPIWIKFYISHLYGSCTKNRFKQSWSIHGKQLKTTSLEPSDRFCWCFCRSMSGTSFLNKRLKSFSISLKTDLQSVEWIWEKKVKFQKHGSFEQGINFLQDH